MTSLNDPPSEVLRWDREVAAVDAPQITIEGELEHFHFHGEDAESQPAAPAKSHPVVSVPAPAPMVATLGSLTFHGSPLAPGIGSADVLAEGKPVFRMLVDAVVCPLATPLPHGGGVVMPMGPPPAIFVNGFAIARAGDAVMELVGGPNPIALGATTVLAGPPAPPTMSVDPSSGAPAAGEVRTRRNESTPSGDAALAVSSEGQMVSGGAASLVRIDGEVPLDVTLFGEIEQTVGTWKGHGDVLCDPGVGTDLELLREGDE
jgi:uncharacterized Zn-binding protein involved in type VI secretion